LRQIHTNDVLLVPRSDEFEGQGQRSKVKVARDKKRYFRPFRRPAKRFIFGKSQIPLRYLDRTSFEPAPNQLRSGSKPVRSLHYITL